MDLISVIVPVYNVERYLLRCVESIQKQTYKNIEIILVDDVSPDNCPKMCDELVDSDSRMKVVHRKENGGLGFARNSGLEAATGEYVTFIDSDDWIEETHIENLYSAICNSDADLAMGAHTSVNAKGEKTPHHITVKEGLYNKDDILNKILLPLIGPDVNYPNDVQINSSCCMNLYKMEIIRKNNLKFISERYAVGEDLYFNVDFFVSADKLVALDEVGYYYFENEESISRKYNPKRFERTLNYYTKLYEQVEEYGLSDKIEHRIERTYLMKIRVAIRHIILSDLKRKEKIREIKSILDNEITKKVLSGYPINTFILSMRLLVKLMRSGNVYGVYYLMKFRESAKKQQFLKKILKLLGIGK